MRAELDEIYGETVTIINRLDAKHAALKQDVYYPTVLLNCMWRDESKSGTSSSGVVTPSTIHTVQIPKDAGNYVKYRDWRNLESKNSAFTLRAGDYVVRGKVDGPVTADNIRTIIADYEPDAWQVKAWRELTIPDWSLKRVAGLPLYRFFLEG